jgi:hypothetical protein
VSFFYFSLSRLKRFFAAKEAFSSFFPPDIFIISLLCVQRSSCFSFCFNGLLELFCSLKEGGEKKGRAALSSQIARASFLVKSFLQLN